MPLILVGADTPIGVDILDRLDGRTREVRVFVTDESAGLHMKERGFKVATGDVSDESHVEAAALRCFSAVLIGDAAVDGRERSFATTPEEVMQGWARAVSRSKVKRVIWVTEDDPPETGAVETVRVDPSAPDLASVIVDLDEAASIE